jgi:hypothetical protein
VTLLSAYFLYPEKRETDMSKENPTYAEAVLMAGVGVGRLAFFFGATIGGAALIGAGTGVAVGVGIPVIVGGA